MGCPQWPVDQARVINVGIKALIATEWFAKFDASTASSGTIFCKNRRNSRHHALIDEGNYLQLLTLQKKKSRSDQLGASASHRQTIVKAFASLAAHEGLVDHLDIRMSFILLIRANTKPEVSESMFQSIAVFLRGGSAYGKSFVADLVNSYYRNVPLKLILGLLNEQG